MSAPVREFTAGAAMFTRHDARTRRCLGDFAARLKERTYQELLTAERVAERWRHPLAREIRAIIRREILRREATVTGGTR